MVRDRDAMTRDGNTVSHSPSCQGPAGWPARAWSVRPCLGARSCGAQRSITGTMRSKILMSKAVSVSTVSRNGYRHSQAEVRSAQPRVALITASNPDIA